MAYSQDLKERVLSYVLQGNSKAETIRIFKLSRTTLFMWLRQPANHLPGKPGPKASYKFDQEELRVEVESHPDRVLRELAASRKVGVNAIAKALKRMGVVRKKNTSIRRKPERS